MGRRSPSPVPNLCFLKRKQEDILHSLKALQKKKKAAEKSAALCFGSMFTWSNIYTHPLCPPLEQMYFWGSYPIMFKRGK
jgi:hypothetical protein